MEINLYTVAQLIQQKNEVKKLPIRIANKKTTLNDKAPVIKCSSCGAEIMVVPNVKLMSEAIEAHVAKHKLKVKNPVKAEAEADQIRDDLIAQIFDAASEQ